MAGFAADFEFLATSAWRSIADVREALATAPPLRLGRGQGLRDHIELVLEVLEEETHKAQRQGQDAKKPVEQRGVLRRLHRLIAQARHMRHAVPFLEPPDRELGLGVQYVVDEAADHLVGDEIDLIPVPLDSQTIATLSWPFDPLLKSHGRGEQIGTRPILVLYPRSEAETLLLAPVLIHEVAHPAVDRYRLVDEVRSRALSVTRYVEARQQAIAVNARERGIDRKASKKIVDGRLRAYLAEMLCDAIASFYLGPSYVFPFAGIVAATSRERLQQDHPPTTFRIARILRQLRSSTVGWGDWLRDEASAINVWLDHIANTPVAPHGPYETQLIEAVDAATAVVQDVARSHVGEHAFTYDAYRAARDSHELEDLLAYDILPAQSCDGGPFDARAIMLAGWIDGIRKKSREEPDDSDDTEQGEDEDQEDEELAYQAKAEYPPPDELRPAAIPAAVRDMESQVFLDKAVELSIVLRTWKDLK